LWWQWRQYGGNKSGDKSSDKSSNKVAEKCERKNLIQCECFHDEENEVREKRREEQWRQRLAVAVVVALAEENLEKR